MSGPGVVQLFRCLGICDCDGLWFLFYIYCCFVTSLCPMLVFSIAQSGFIHIWLPTESLLLMVSGKKQQCWIEILYPFPACRWCDGGVMSSLTTVIALQVKFKPSDDSNCCQPLMSQDKVVVCRHLNFHCSPWRHKVSWDWGEPLKSFLLSCPCGSCYCKASSLKKETTWHHVLFSILVHFNSNV